jgi:dCMP deaminase
MQRPTIEEWALKLALVTAQRGTCSLRQVGCILLDKHNHVLATGYNGAAAGLPHCLHVAAPRCIACGEPLEWFKDHYSSICSVCDEDNKANPLLSNPAYQTSAEGCDAIHAEQNALLQCSNVKEIEVAYVTTAPCVTCTKLLLNTSCRKIVFITSYPAETAKNLWEKSGRLWVQKLAGL